MEGDCLLVYAKAKRGRQLGEDLKNANKAFLSGPYAGFPFLFKFHFSFFFFAFFESKKCLDKLKIVRVKVLWAEENLFSALVTRIWVKVFVFCFHYSYYCCC